jgi:hypothetical protein
MDTVRENGFSLEVLSKGITARKHIIHNANYISLSHNSEYKLRLTNDNDTRVDATVWIDNENVGTWRVKPYRSITIERPVNVSRKFTFLEENTSSAYESGIVSGAEENGLIKVIFKPEKKHVSFGLLSVNSTCRNGNHNLNSHSLETNRSQSYGMDFSSGGTGLGDYSSQRFSHTSALFDIDYSNITTLTTRLVISNRSPRKFIPLKSTKYPNRLDDIKPYPFRSSRFYHPYY